MEVVEKCIDGTKKVCTRLEGLVEMLCDVSVFYRYTHTH